MTAALVEVVVVDGADATATDRSRRSMYAMTIVRFINAFVDLEQKKLFAQSVSSLAERLNIPAWIVDLRHEASHDRLPSLAVLRLAARQALQWLHQGYWAVQTVDQSEKRNELSQLLIRYKKAKKDDHKTEAKVVAEEMVQLIRIPPTAAPQLIDLLLEPGFLVPASKRKRPETYQDALATEQTDLWQPLLTSLEAAAPDFLQSLLDAILERLGQQFRPAHQALAEEAATAAAAAAARTKTYNPSYCLTLVAWSKHLLQRLNLAGADLVARLQSVVQFATSRYASVLPPEKLARIKGVCAFVDRCTAAQQLPPTHAANNKRKTVDDMLFDDDRERAQTFLDNMFRQLDEYKRFRQRRRREAADAQADREAETLQALAASGWTQINDYTTAVPLGCLPDRTLTQLDLFAPAQCMDVLTVTDTSWSPVTAKSAVISEETSNAPSPSPMGDVAVEPGAAPGTLVVSLW
ncbi:rRNA-processing protein las1 [Sorochytrium milnesiophthora]